MQREYGYIGPEEQGEPADCHAEGTECSWLPVGIFLPDNVWYPLVPGNVVNACNCDFPGADEGGARAGHP